MRPFPADHLRRTLEQLEPHIAGDVALSFRDERVKRVAQGAEPQAVVDHLGPLLSDQVFETRDLFRKGDVLQCLVGLQQEHRSRSLIDLARLDTDEAILQVIDPSDTVLATNSVEFGHEPKGVNRFTFERYRQSMLETNLHVRGFVRTVARISGPAVDVAWRFGPGVLQHPRLDRSSPQVFIGRVGRPHRGRHLDAVPGGVLDLVVAVHAPLADRCDHLEVWREGGRGHVESHLVVALAGAAVRDGGRTLAARHLDHHRRDQRAAERGRERVFLLVHGTGLQRGPHEELEEGRPSVRDIGRRRADFQCARLDRVEVLLLTQVDGERDHVPAEIFQPPDRHRRVEAARVGEHELLLSRHAGAGPSRRDRRWACAARR